MLHTKGACNVPLTKTDKDFLDIFWIFYNHDTTPVCPNIPRVYAWESMRMPLYLILCINIMYNCNIMSFFLYVVVRQYASDSYGVKCTLCKYTKHILFPNAIHNIIHYHRLSFSTFLFHVNYCHFRATVWRESC